MDEPIEEKIGFEIKPCIPKQHIPGGSKPCRELHLSVCTVIVHAMKWDQNHSSFPLFFLNHQEKTQGRATRSEEKSVHLFSLICIFSPAWLACTRETQVVEIPWLYELLHPSWWVEMRGDRIGDSTLHYGNPAFFFTLRKQIVSAEYWTGIFQVRLVPSYAITGTWINAILDKKNCCSFTWWYNNR